MMRPYWCHQCERVWIMPVCKLGTPCPDPECKGHGSIDIWPWKSMLKTHPKWPVAPAHGQHFPCYPPPQWTPPTDPPNDP